MIRKNKPLISVITVVKNDEEGISKTIDSVSKQKGDKFEFIVVDGSDDIETSKYIIENRDKIDFLISEKDHGIYDAMNKGIEAANADWLIFLNAGDIFSTDEIVSYLAEKTSGDAELLYSDTILRGKTERLFVCDSKRLRIIHQSLLYKKNLHSLYGKYIVSPKLIISDYIFFNLVKDKKWEKIDKIISICDDGGVSSQRKMFYQKMGVDFIFENRGRIYTAIILVLYPIYKTIKNICLRKTKARNK